MLVLSTKQRASPEQDVRLKFHVAMPFIENLPTHVNHLTLNGEQEHPKSKESTAFSIIIKIAMNA